MLGLFRLAAAGAVGAMAMTGMRMVTTQLGVVKQVPPEAILAQGTPRLLRRVPKEKRKVTIELAHWTYGAFGGAIFGALPALAREKPYAGALYGLGLWVVLETVIEPVLGIRRKRFGRPAERVAFIVDHALYGMVLAAADRPPTPTSARSSDSARAEGRSSSAPPP